MGSVGTGPGADEIRTNVIYNEIKAIPVSIDNRWSAASTVII